MKLRRRLFRDDYFRRGFWLFVFGSGPLLGSISATHLGLTRDPNPNPIFAGVLFFFTFLPSIILMAIGLFRVIGRTDGA